MVSHNTLRFILQYNFQKDNYGKFVDCLKCYFYMQHNSKGFCSPNLPLNIIKICFSVFKLNLYADKIMIFRNDKWEVEEVDNQPFIPIGLKRRLSSGRRWKIMCERYHRIMQVWKNIR